MAGKNPYIYPGLENKNPVYPTLNKTVLDRYENSPVAYNFSNKLAFPPAGVSMPGVIPDENRSVRYENNYKLAPSPAGVSIPRVKGNIPEDMSMRYNFNTSLAPKLPGTIDINQVSAITPTRRMIRQAKRNLTGSTISSKDNTNNNTSTNSTTTQSPDRSYNRNLLYNSIKSWGRHYPTFDSVQQYLDKKKNTPDMSDFENAKNYAMRPTDVQRQTANHISGNLKFNPYDYSAQANMINAQAANGVNAISRQGRGNINAIAGHINNLLSNTATSAGNEYMKGFEANEKARMAVAQANMEADKFNATADNNAEANYVQSRNNAATQDKTNAINALNNYASQRYAINGNYENQLRTLRDQMVSNIGEEGRTAYETNRANTNKQYNYWYDQNGVQHYIPQEGGARYVDPQNPEPYKIEDGEFAKVLDKYKDDNAVRDELYKMMNTNGYARGRYDWYNKYKA